MSPPALRRLGAFFFVLFLVSGGTPVFAYYSSYSSADQGRGILFCAAGLVGGVAAFFWGFAQLRTKRLMQDIPLSTVRAMAPGLVEISGSAVDWCPFEGPLSGRKCVYYEYEIEQYVSSGKNCHWETILSGNSKTSPFFIQDETGMVMVAPEGSKVIIPRAYQLETGVFTEVPGRISDFMDRRGVSCRSFFGFEKKLRFTERHLEPVDKVFVMGTCQESSARLTEPPSGATSGLCVAKGLRSSEVFILSDESQRELESSFGDHAFFGIFGGLALIGGCLYGLLNLLGIA